MDGHYNVKKDAVEQLEHQRLTVWIWSTSSFDGYIWRKDVMFRQKYGSKADKEVIDKREIVLMQELSDGSVADR